MPLNPAAFPGALVVQPLPGLIDGPPQGRFSPASIVRPFGGASPGGTGVSIAAASTGAAAVGDMVLILFSWAAGSIALSTVTDTSANTWNVVSTPAPANQSGGYGWCIVTTGWAAGANTITGTLASGAPGGREWVAVVIPAAFSPVFDQHNETSTTTQNVSITTTSALAQASEAVIITDIVRASGAPQIPSWYWNTPFADEGHQVGGGTINSGAAIGAFDNRVGTTAVTGSFLSAASDNHGNSIIAFKVTYPSSGTTFLVSIIVGTVTLPVTLIRKGLLIILPTVSTPVTIVRLGKLIISASASTPVTLVRKGLLFIITGTVTLPVTIVTRLIHAITIVVGTVTTPVTLIRKGLLNILPTVSTPVTLQRLAKLVIGPTVSTTATVARKGLLGVSVGAVSAAASVVVTFVPFFVNLISDAANTVWMFVSQNVLRMGQTTNQADVAPSQNNVIIDQSTNSVDVEEIG